MSDNRYDISVVIPVYNAGALINRCLDSVFSQSARRSVEVILIDDGSTDNSVELIGQRPEQQHITLLRQRNSGPAAARNKGIGAASGKYLAFIDADDYWLPGFVDTTADFLDNHGECIAVSTAQRHITTSGSHESPGNWKNLAAPGGSVLPDFYSFWADHNHVCTGSILIRTDIVRKTGGQREDLRICEDLEFWAYLATFGPMGYIPELLFVSDGGKVTAEVGWVEKHLPRWNSAVPVEEWQRRIATRMEEPLPAGFVRARGRIARNLGYSILLSKRYALAKEQIKRYNRDFPLDNMTRVLRMAVATPLSWIVISRLLTYREYHRK